MSNTRTGLMYSELTSRIYWGTVNNKTGIARDGKKDVTSEFIQVMLQKFPINFSQEIVADGEYKATVIIADKASSHRLFASQDMYNMLEAIADDTPPNEQLFLQIHNILAKARGEHV